MAGPISTEGILSRLSGIFQGNVHKLLDKVEDKVTSLEQQIREYKRELEEADQAEHDVRKQLIIIDGQIETAKAAVEKAKADAKAVLVKGQSTGKLEEAKSIANEIMDQAKPQAEQLKSLNSQKTKIQASLDTMIAQKSHYTEYVRTLESELDTLRARKQTAESLKKLQGHEINIDGSGAANKLARLKADVADAEADVLASEQMLTEPVDTLEERKKGFLGEGDAPVSSEVDKLMAELGIVESKPAV